MKLKVPSNRLRDARASARVRRQVDYVESYLSSLEPRAVAGDDPVIFFNASTRIHRLSLNAAFGLLASWATRIEGVPTWHVYCHQGMQQCILGTNLQDLTAAPPCSRCIQFGTGLFHQDRTISLTMNLRLIKDLRAELSGQSLERLSEWEYEGLPLGQLCLPGLRWALRRHHLPDHASVQELYRKYLLSAASLSESFTEILQNRRPRALVVFNGIFYPEAVARHVALRMNIPVVTHEVGLRPMSAFFSHEHATFRQVDLGNDSELTPEQDHELEKVLADRFKGRFSMAGVRFWEEMESLPGWLLEKMSQFRQTVSVFANVVFDTSQVHASVLYDDMFDWLNDMRRTFGNHPETLFILRAHPDEDRPGKRSRESVAEWVDTHQLRARKNVVFFGASERASSYELIQRSKFVLIYNSSIGLEAAILSKPVLCAGRARFTTIPAVYFADTREMYSELLERFLGSNDLEVPADFVANARKFLYVELFRASLDLSAFLRPSRAMPGMVNFSEFDPATIEHDESMRVIKSGILHGTPFLMR